MRLEAAGERVATLALLDSFPLPDSYRTAGVDRRWVVEALLGGERHPVPASDGELVRLLRTEDAVLGMLEPGQVADVVRTTYDNLRAFARYSIRGAFRGDVLYFRALRTPAEATPAEAWAPYVRGAFEVHGVDCAHSEMNGRAPLEVIGGLLDERLRQGAVQLPS